MSIQRKLPFVLGMCLVVPGCATTKFAPAFVSTDRVMLSTQTRGTACAYGIAVFKPGEAIVPGLKGAQDLIRNYVRIYRCAADDTSNGRQFFQSPALLGIGGAALAMALGAGPTVGIAAGGGAAVLNSFNGYYDPKSKAAIYAKALDSITCIQRQSLETGAYSAPENTARRAAKAAGSQAFPWSQRYFGLIKASLLEVENIVRQRLTNVGTYDPSSLADSIRALDKKIEEAKSAVNPPGMNEEDAGTALVIDSVAKDGTVNQKQVEVGTGGTVSLAGAQQLLALEPRLEQCVIRAKA